MQESTSFALPIHTSIYAMYTRNFIEDISIDRCATPFAQPLWLLLPMSTSFTDVVRARTLLERARRAFRPLIERPPEDLEQGLCEALERRALTKAQKGLVGQRCRRLGASKRLDVRCFAPCWAISGRILDGNHRARPGMSSASGLRGRLSTSSDGTTGPTWSEPAFSIAWNLE